MAYSGDRAISTAAALLLAQPWDGVLRPFSINVEGMILKEDRITLKSYMTYQMKVQWDADNHWNVARRYEDCCRIQEGLNRDFAHLPRYYRTTIRKTLFHRLTQVRHAIVCISCYIITVSHGTNTNSPRTNTTIPHRVKRTTRNSYKPAYDAVS